MGSMAHVDASFTQAVESKAMPGIVAMAATDKGVLYEGAFGRRELGKNAPMTLDTVVWIASMTKAITATAAMQLVERGKLALDAPASQLAPGLAKAQVLEGFEAASGQKLDAYLQQNVLGPLGMKDTSFSLSPSQRARLASVHQRDDKGALAPIEFSLPENPEFHMGGGGLNGTAPDYLAFTQMIMHGGRFNGAQVLRPETVDQMAQNHIGPLEIGAMTSAIPALTNDVELFPGMSKKWGLSFLINTAQAPTGRSAGSLAWAGLANTYFWIDRDKRVCGVFLSQVLPFFDHTAIDLLTKFETEVYRAL